LSNAAPSITSCLTPLEAYIFI